MVSAIVYVLLLAFATIFSTNAHDLKTYIVHLTQPQHSHDHLKHWYNSILSKAVSASDHHKPTIMYTYHHVITGFAAKMSVEQAKALENMKQQVASVMPESVFHLHTTHTPQFLGLRQNSGFWKHSNYGKGIIIGVLDTGITPGHPSFNDKGVPPPPPRWKGKCEVAGCNNKLIGMRNFYPKSSPIDKSGHGTHTSTTAAGSPVDNANVFGQANGTATGIAPLAHLAMYKVCDDEYCSESAIIAGMDAAVGDGVDVISISLGGGMSSFYQNNVMIAAFAAQQKGIFVSCSAGNEGPYNSSLSNEAPWVLTVGASTIDRRIRTTVILGNNKSFDGESLYQPKDFDYYMFRSLVYPGGKSGDQEAAWCMEESLDPNDVKGKVVLCDVGGFNDGVGKSKVVKDAGGVAMILANDIDFGETLFAEANVVPSSNVGYKEAVEIKKYLNSTTSPVATIIFRGTVLGIKSAPEVAFFSSRGPNYASPGILKPDIIGPGVDILAAWWQSVDNMTTGTKSTFNVVSGTSMSCPHLAGTAALLKSAHPEWSPAVIKSAIMTTAGQVSLNGHAIVDQRELPADVFAIGSGHVNPSKANDPGLVYDIQPDDYIPYLCGLGYTPKQVAIIVKRNVSCAKSIPEAELNYPSFAVTLKRGDSKTYSRTVTNVGMANSSYRVGEIYAPEGVNVVVGSQDELRFRAMHQKLRYEITFSRDSKDKARDLYGQGHMTWVSTSTKYSVRTPFSFKLE